MAFVKLCTLMFLACVGTGRSLDCYVCRGCVTVGPDDVQTCAARPTAAPPAEPTTDNDVNFGNDVVEMAHVPFIRELEEEGRKSQQFVLDDSELPGARFLTRGLQQYRDNEAGDDGARCVISVYQEVDGTQNVVRDCAVAQADNATLCSDAVRDDFDGSILYCNVCQEDLCNAASKSAAAALAILAAVAFNVFN